MQQQIAGMGVHVAHQHLVAIAADQFTDIGQLAGAGACAQGQVHDHHHQRLRPFAETQQDRPAPWRAGQWMVLQALRLQAAEHAVAVLGQAAEVAVELLVPEGKGGEFGQVLDLVDEAGAQAAAVHFLQRDQVIIAKQGGNLLQIAGAPAVRQQMLPAAGQVVAVALGADADLDIEAEQAQQAISRQAGGFRAASVDLRQVQTDRTPGTPAAQHGGLLSERHALGR
ncbi:hypothetical protein D3C84_763640 [compost metagenome]